MPAWVTNVVFARLIQTSRWISLPSPSRIKTLTNTNLSWYSPTWPQKKIIIIGNQLRIMRTYPCICYIIRLNLSKTSSLYFPFTKAFQARFFCQQKVQFPLKCDARWNTQFSIDKRYFITVSFHREKVNALSYTANQKNETVLRFMKQ